MAHHRIALLSRSLLALAVLAVALGPPRPAQAAYPDPPGGYLPPVADGEITDHFRPPSTPYGAGNRGIDERTVPGSLVLASADGEVVFAGAVAGSLHITLLHGDGLRTSYSFLASILVQPGQRVARGTPIGTTGAIFHFGVRDPLGAYLDPEALWAGHLGVRLVAGNDEGGPGVSTGDERRGLAAVVAGLGNDARRNLLLARAHEAAMVDPVIDLLALRRELRAWSTSQQGCAPTDVTAAGQTAPPPPGRRVMVLVGGLGSSGASAAVDQVDTAALGYAPDDVVRFSYAGGRVPDHRDARAAGGVPGMPGGPDRKGGLGQIAAHDYLPGDTRRSLRQAGERLADLLAAVQRAAPGVPVDVIAHSQGGVVARLALADRTPGVATLTTLGTPSQGTELATAVAGLGFGSGHRPGSGPGTAVVELSETSVLIGELDRASPPDGVRMLSIGASGDLTVPAVRTVAPGGANVILHLAGLHAHEELPGDPRVTREIARFRAGLAPGCADVRTGLGDVVQSHLIGRAETALGLGLDGLSDSVGPLDPGSLH
jgi:hypothetical protein